MELTVKDSNWAKEVIRQSDFFDTLTEQELAQLVEGFEKRHYTKGTIIIFQGEISNKLFIIQSGKVSVNVRRRKQVTKVAELVPTDLFGEISLLTPRSATATVKVEEDSDIIILAGDVFRGIVKNNPALDEKIRKKIDERLKMHDQLENPEQAIFSAILPKETPRHKLDEEDED
ncbi:MAG: cyclic nucleotide-binding domain-containing protein [Elusimicrobia bacterium]|nr:cyclic nucleotide-binding domain-containing protein [Elusimicrobiota bacterium]